MTSLSATTVSSTNQEKFAKAERAEELFAEMYRVLAGLFADEPDAVTMFTRLADEEVQHALRVHMLYERYRRHPSEFRDVPIDDSELDAILAQALLVLDDLRRRATPMTAAQARSAMVALERRMGAVHAEILSKDADPSIAQFFAALGAMDRGHAELLASLPLASEVLHRI